MKADFTKIKRRVEDKTRLLAPLKTTKNADLERFNQSFKMRTPKLADPDIKQLLNQHRESSQNETYLKKL